MPTWLILTLSSIFVLAVAEIAQKTALTKTENISAEANNFVVWIVQGTLALLYVFIFKIAWPEVFSVGEILKLVALGIIYFWAGTLYYSSYKEGSISISTVLGSLSIIVSTTLGIVFFQESLNWLKIFGSLLIINSIIYLNYTKNEKLKKANLLALAGAGLYGIGYTMDKGFALQFTPHIYQVLFAYSIGLTGLAFRGRKIFSDLVRVKLSTFKVMLISAVTFLIWNKLNFVAYTIGGEVGKIDSINNTVVFIIILLEILILKVRENLPKKLLAASIAFVGIFLLSFSK